MKRGKFNLDNKTAIISFCGSSAPAFATWRISFACFFLQSPVHYLAWKHFRVCHHKLICGISASILPYSRPQMQDINSRGHFRSRRVIWTHISLCAPLRVSVLILCTSKHLLWIYRDVYPTLLPGTTNCSIKINRLPHFLPKFHTKRKKNIYVQCDVAFCDAL